MFVQSAKFIERHKENPGKAISIYGEEKVAETIRLCKMNLAVNGLSGDIKQGNTITRTYTGRLENTISSWPIRRSM
jgi:type I restriction enzyme M protein